jgi:RNA polymerase sigma-70 factor (ECF subfamily)
VSIAPTQATATDGALLRAVASGDPQAFAELVERHQASFFRVAARTVGDEREAQDCVQLAFFRIFRKARDYRPDLPAAPWLYRILTNACIDAWRRRRRELPTAEPRVGSARPVDGARLDLAAALARLPTQTRVVFLLHAMEGLSSPEIAAVRGVSVNTVKTQISRARKTMRALLAEETR